MRMCLYIGPGSCQAEPAWDFCVRIKVSSVEDEASYIPAPTTTISKFNSAMLKCAGDETQFDLLFQDRRRFLAILRDQLYAQ